MSVLNKDKAPGFFKPTQLPANLSQSQSWSFSNRLWWEKYPMTYNRDHHPPISDLDINFFNYIDKIFFTSANVFCPTKSLPFDSLIKFDQLKDKRVLEIGVGLGSHAQLLATRCREFTGIDLTEYAASATTKRLTLANISNAQIFQMDAEQLSSPDNSFDFVWAWGVVHHSANPVEILRQIHRVLQPGGRAVFMVYYRGWWNYYLFRGLIQGLFKGEWLHTKSIHQVVQNVTDGALARYYTAPEWRQNLEKQGLKMTKCLVMGEKTEVIILPKGRIKDLLLKLLPNWLSRFLTNYCKMGSFLVTEAIKI
jgi:ubiquinone/menaquinone biosynthesis C-methylase UbiE